MTDAKKTVDHDRIHSCLKDMTREERATALLSLCRLLYEAEWDGSNGGYAEVIREHRRKVWQTFEAA